MSTNFKKAVEKVKNGWFVGKEISLTYYTTPYGQNFAILVTKGLWYKVRVFLEDEYPDWNIVYPSHLNVEQIANKFLKKQFEMVAYGKNLPEIIVENLHPSAVPWVGPILAETQHMRSGKDEKVANWTTFFNQATLEAAKNLKFSDDFSDSFFQASVPSDWANDPDKYIKRGDVLTCKFVTILFHAGVYLGNGQVAHVSGHGGDKESAVARKGNLLGDFVKEQSDSIQIIYFVLRVRSREDIARAAEAYVEERFWAGEYDLLNRNCQHFVRLCATGEE